MQRAISAEIMRLPYKRLSFSLCICVDGNSPQLREQERVALQKGFVDYVIGPYYKLVAAAYPAVAPVFELIKQNRETWNRELSPPCVCVCVCVCVCMCVCVQGCIVVWIRAPRTVLCEIFLRIRPLPHGVEVEVVAARVRWCRARALRVYSRRVRVCRRDVKNTDEHACVDTE